MPNVKAIPAASAYLENLQLGASIAVAINGEQVAAKFRSYLPSATEFTCTVKGKITRCELRHLVIPGVEPIPAPTPKVVPTPKPEEAPRSKKGERVDMSKATGHKWDKKNLMTQSVGGRSFDTWGCNTCGLEGRRYGVSDSIEVTKEVKKTATQCVDLPIKTPLERGITHIELLKIGSNHAAYSLLEVGKIYAVVDAPEQYAKYLEDVWIEGNGEACRLFEDEWEAAPAPIVVVALKSGGFVTQGLNPEADANRRAQNNHVMQVVRDEEPVAEKPHVAEFSQRILMALAENGGPMLASVLAVRLNEGLKRVAASFTNLGKQGLIESHGGKGEKTVELTAAGWDFTGLSNPTKYVDAPVDETNVLPALEEVGFQITPEHVLAMELVGANGAEVTDIFTAQHLNDLENREPYPIVKTPAKTEDGYFFAALTNEGAEYAAFMRQVLRMEPKAPVAPEKATVPAQGKRGRKKGSTAEVLADKLITAARSTGRAGGARKSVRELALAAFASKANGKLGYREVVKALADGTDFTVTQLQNAAFKLTKAGFLVADSEGRTASPLQLTAAGKAGYKTNHGGERLRPIIEGFIEDGMNNNDIAQRVGCDVAYVNDVRTGRRLNYREKQEAKAKLAEDTVAE